MSKSKLIQDFMGWELIQRDSQWLFVNKFTEETISRTFYNNSELPYETDWNYLMEALKRFDNFDFFNNRTIEETNNYSYLCDQIDYAVTLYNINDAVNALCEGIEWYNTTLN